LEGGAMVMADGGIVCIDEFDKMRVQDRVAIHEAMEQQTISIAKAGITTILNSRTAVLAAANPNFGSYDDTRTTQENLNEFRSTILSRFDCIFLIRDTRNEERDLIIAKHVMNVHMKASMGDEPTPIPLLTLKRYISFCRSKCEPRLSESATTILGDKYVALRTSHRTRELEGTTSIPITVRQLEAIVRISEALAKITLSPQAEEKHVEEAIRLFTVSTIDAINSGKVESEQMTEQMLAEVENAENKIKSRMPIGSRSSIKRLVDTLYRTYNIEEIVTRKAIYVMASRDEVDYQSKRQNIIRKR